MGEKPLTTEELRQMAGQPVWCPDDEAYGIVMCDKSGNGQAFHSCTEYGTGMAMAAVWNLIIISSREG